MGPKILFLRSHSSGNFQTILYCLVPSFKLKCENFETINADRVDTVVFNLHPIKCRAFSRTPHKGNYGTIYYIARYKIGI